MLIFDTYLEYYRMIFILSKCENNTNYFDKIVVCLIKPWYNFSSSERRANLRGLANKRTSNSTQ